jgi:hypothetical protein
MSNRLKHFAILLCCYIILSILFLDSYTMRKEKIHQYEGIVVTAAFNHIPDPQRAYIHNSSFDYIRTWYMSLSKHSRLKGYILHNMFSYDDVIRYSSLQIEFIYIDPKRHPSFHIDDGLIRGMGDQRYFLYDWFFESLLFKHMLANLRYPYVILTDCYDVEFMKNPISFMLSTDARTNSQNLYVGDEYKPSIKWLEKYWNQCCNDTNPPIWLENPVYNPGLIGGNYRSLRILTKWMKMRVQVLNSSMCDMVLLEKYIIKYNVSVIHGHPFNSKYKCYETNSTAFLRHK